MCNDASNLLASKICADNIMKTYENVTQLLNDKQKIIFSSSDSQSITCKIIGMYRQIMEYSNSVSQHYTHNLYAPRCPLNSNHPPITTLVQCVMDIGINVKITLKDIIDCVNPDLLLMLISKNMINIPEYPKDSECIISYVIRRSNKYDFAAIINNGRWIMVDNGERYAKIIDILIKHGMPCIYNGSLYADNKYVRDFLQYNKICYELTKMIAEFISVDVCPIIASYCTKIETDDSALSNALVF